MTKVRIFPKTLGTPKTQSNPLPRVLHTPSGLALLEIQGTLNSTISREDDATGPALNVGKLDFPLYDANDTSGDTTWQKRVHLFVGDNQRLTGELKRLPNPVAVLQKRSNTASEDLEIAAIIYYKLMFAHRPEPFGIVATE